MAGIERIRSVAGRVKREAEAGNEVLVVVSAMAGETDRRIPLAVLASAAGEGAHTRRRRGVGLHARGTHGARVPCCDGAAPDGHHRGDE